MKSFFMLFGVKSCLNKKKSTWKMSEKIKKVSSKLLHPRLTLTQNILFFPEMKIIIVIKIYFAFRISKLIKLLFPLFFQVVFFFYFLTSRREFFEIFHFFIFFLFLIAVLALLSFISCVERHLQYPHFGSTSQNLSFVARLADSCV